MSIRFSCSCGRKLKVSDEKIGMKVLCSSCGATLKVPKKSQDTYWQDVPGKPAESQVDYAAAFKEFATKFVPGLALIGVVVFGADYLSSQIIVGRGNLPALGRVSGKVTLDGQPLANATVRFIPLNDEGTQERKGASIAMGLTDESGHYRLFYVKDTAGAAVGKNVVDFEAKDKLGRDRFRHDFDGQKILIREVKSGSQEMDFALEGHRERHSKHPNLNANASLTLAGRGTIDERSIFDTADRQACSHLYGDYAPLAR